MNLTATRRCGALCLCVLCLSGAAADTILIGDFCGADGGRTPDPCFSLGLPYFIARAINGSGDCEALLSAAPHSKTLSTLYDARGMPRVGEARTLCARAGADRYLLGAFAKRKDSAGRGETASVTFYNGSASGDGTDVFKTGVAGGDESLPALAAHAAGRACRLVQDPLPPRVPPGFLPPFSRALQLLGDGDLGGASRNAAQLSEDYPESADARYLNGLVALGAKKPYMALRLFNEARNLDPAFSMPAYQEGLVWLSLERTTLAERAFEQAARIQPAFFEAVFQSGKLKAVRGDCASALGELRRAIKLRPKDSGARYWLAHCLVNRGRGDEGRRILEGLIADSPGYGPAHLLLGKLFYETGKFHAAEIELRSAVRLCPDDPEAHRLLGESLSKQGGYNRHAEAVEEFQKALLLERRR
ncbi:MAG: tetratricopeptide repeat protein [Candidatus Aureabacteria bacterium]|nr:tetratricopeptide repeat protein [Candidatus Auribacterota bacterium]